MNSEFDEFLSIKFDKEQANVMCDIDNECKKHTVIENGRRVLRLVLNKDSHGHVQTALSYHEMLSSFLIDLGIFVWRARTSKDHNAL